MLQLIPLADHASCKMLSTTHSYGINSSVEILQFSYHFSFSWITVTSGGIWNAFCIAFFVFYSIDLFYFRETVVLLYLQLLQVYLLWKVSLLLDTPLLVLILGMKGDASWYSTGSCKIHAKFCHLYLWSVTCDTGDRATNIAPVQVPLWNCWVSFKHVTQFPLYNKKRNVSRSPLSSTGLSLSLCTHPTYSGTWWEWKCFPFSVWMNYTDLANSR